MNDDLRAAALALRDLQEVTGALGARLVFDDSTELIVEDGGVHLVRPGEPGLDVTTLVEWTGLVPA